MRSLAHSGLSRPKPGRTRACDRREASPSSFALSRTRQTKRVNIGRSNGAALHEIAPKDIPLTLCDSNNSHHIQQQNDHRSSSRRSTTETALCSFGPIPGVSDDRTRKRAPTSTYAREPSTPRGRRSRSCLLESEGPITPSFWAHHRHLRHRKLPPTFLCLCPPKRSATYKHPSAWEHLCKNREPRTTPDAIRQAQTTKLKLNRATTQANHIFALPLLL